VRAVELVVVVLDGTAQFDRDGAGVPHLDRVLEGQLTHGEADGLEDLVLVAAHEEALYETAGISDTGENLPAVLGVQTEVVDQVAGELLAGDGVGHCDMFLSDWWNLKLILLHTVLR